MKNNISFTLHLKIRVQYVFSHSLIWCTTYARSRRYGLLEQLPSTLHRERIIWNENSKLSSPQGYGDVTSGKFCRDLAIASWTGVLETRFQHNSNIHVIAIVRPPMHQGLKHATTRHTGAWLHEQRSRILKMACDNADYQIVASQAYDCTMVASFMLCLCSQIRYRIESTKPHFLPS